MEDNNINNDQNNSFDETNSNVRVERHKWPDEIKVERKRVRSNIFTVLIFSIVFFVLGIFISKSSIFSSGSTTGNTKLDAINKIMTTDWYFGKDIEDLDTKLFDKALYGLTDVEEVDPHTTYLSSEEMSQYTTNLSGSYVGIGIQYYQSESGSLIVQRVFDNSPSQDAGVEAGDILIKVEGESVEGLTMDEVSGKVKGEKDTVVKITMLREGVEKDFEITRREVLHSVFGEVVEEDIGYIELDQFGESTAQEVLNYLQKFEGKQSKLIIDLRDNGGGYLDTVIDIASYLIPKDKIVLITEDIKGNQTKENTNSDQQFEFDKIIVLVNGNTASASEVLTAALSEHLDNVSVIGTQTYGKGTVQYSRVFPDGSALKYTAAEWLTPSGKKIHGEGITPDYIVELHKVLNTQFPAFDENTVYKYDSVSEALMTSQLALDFLGYKVDRFDGYFDNSTLEAIMAFQSDSNLTSNGEVNSELYNMLMSKTIREWTANKNQYDFQFDKAIELAHEK